MLLPKRIIRSKKSKYTSIINRSEIIDINTADELVSRCFKDKNNEPVKFITTLNENNEVIHTMYIGDESKIVSEVFYKTHLGLILSSKSFLVEKINLTFDNENNLFYKYQKQYKRNTIRKDSTSKRLSLQ